jgi:hypothetical protein
MTNEAKCRHQLYLDRDVSEKLQALAAKPGASTSAILVDAARPSFSATSSRSTRRCPSPTRQRAPSGGTASSPS